MLFRKIVLFLIIAPFTCLNAHPHLFVKPALAVQTIDVDKIVLAVSWEWDQWWSEDILTNCDQNSDGVLDSLDTQLVYRDYFKSLKNFHYFMKIKVNGHTKKIKIENFKPTVKKNKVVLYEFNVRLNNEGELTDTPYRFSVTFDDESGYTAFDRIIKISDPNPAEKYQNIRISGASFYGMKIDFKYMPN